MQKEFRLDNTEGYTPTQLEELNRRFEALAKELDPNDRNFADARKTLAERVLADFDNGKN